MDIEVIEVEVDDQAQTSALGALTDADAAKALRIETARAPSPRIAPPRATKSTPAMPAVKAAPKLKADGTQEIELGDVLEVMQKMAPAKVEIAAQPVIATPAPVNPNATMEIRPGDVLEELVADAPAPSVVIQATPAPMPAVQQQVVTEPMQVAPSQNAAPMFDIPAFPEMAPEPAQSASDLAKTTVRPPAGPKRAQLAQFSVDDEVAPFASDTVDIPLNRVAGLPIWLQIKGKPGAAIVMGAVGACALIGALAIGIHFNNASSDAAATDTTVHTTANATMNHDDPSAAIPPPPATPDVPSVSIDDLKKDGHAKAAVATSSDADPSIAHAWAPPSHHSHASHHSDAPAAPATFTSTKKSTAKQPQGFGLVRTWIAARGETISVDGKAVGTAPTPVKVSCGPHTVAIGAEIVKANVPCDGTITVGSPDHKR